MSDLLFDSIKKGIIRTEPLDDSAFNDLALDLFKYQSHKNPVYKKFCERKGQTRVVNWREIPLMTTESFKKNRHFCLEPTQIAKTFRSSGTTAAQKSQHLLSARELELYELSLWRTFAEAFNLQNAQKLFYCVLTESSLESPNSSLVHMFEVARMKLLASEKCYFVQAGKLDSVGLMSQLNSAASAGCPCLIVGTAFSYVHLLDAGLNKLTLPRGSALMETGGFKGRSREIAKSELYGALAELFNLPLWAIVGQYGMSELGTQYYDRSFLMQSDAKPCRLKEANKWSRVRILNPIDLQSEVPVGEPGLIALYDLANIDSLAFVLTGDVGIRWPNEQFEVLGRAANLSAKGCSLNTDQLFTAGN